MLLAVLGFFFASVPLQAQVTSSQSAATGPARPAYTLRVDKGDMTVISFKAEGAKLSEIAADLSKQLGVPILVGPAWRDAPVSASVSEAPLEQALTALGPRVYVDYELRQDAAPVTREIHLVGFEEPEPAVRGLAQGILIEGHTEQTEKDAEKDPLRVLYENQRLSVIAEQQPLVLIVRTIAETLGVPAEIKYEAPEILDLNVMSLPPEDALVALSPQVRVDLRVDLYSGDRTVKRIALTRTEK